MNADDENADFFKERLFQSFKETGMLDSVKAQLRHKMIEKLLKAQKSNASTLKAEDDKSQMRQLRRRLLSSIVSEYLEKSDMAYTNSVFLPESGYANKTLQRFEILDILQSSSLSDSPQMSVLELILDQHLSTTKTVPQSNCSTQTEHADAVFNLEQRLNVVDNKFRERFLDINTPSQEIEERLSRYKRDFEARLKAEMNAEVVRIKEFEISAVRLDEQECSRKAMVSYREEVEKNYMDKLSKLRDRERDTLEKCTQKMKEIETVNHDHRQRILKDFELLRLREDEVSKQRMLNDETVKVQRHKIDNFEQELKDKIKKAEEAQLIVEKKYQNDLAYTKLEAHRDLEAERLEILEKKRVLDEDMYKIKQMKDTATQFTEQNRKLVEENRRYSEELIEVRKHKKELELELSQLRDNLRSVSDSYKRDVESSRNLEQRIRLKEDEISFFKTALDESKKLADSHKQGQVDNMKKFNNEVQIYQDRIEGLEMKIKELKKTITTSEFQLEQVRRQQVLGTNLPMHTLSQSRNITQEMSMHSAAGNQHNSSTKFTFLKELEDLKEKRKQDFLQPVREHTFEEKKNYNVKFENIWDVSNTSVDFSQLKGRVRDNTAPRDNNTQIEKNYTGDKAEGSRSNLLLQSAGAETNLIEESFHEEHEGDHFDKGRGFENKDTNKGLSSRDFLPSSPFHGSRGGSDLSSGFTDDRRKFGNQQDQSKLNKGFSGISLQPSTGQGLQKKDSKNDWAFEEIEDEFGEGGNARRVEEIESNKGLTGGDTRGGKNLWEKQREKEKVSGSSKSTFNPFGRGIQAHEEEEEDDIFKKTDIFSKGPTKPSALPSLNQKPAVSKGFLAPIDNKQQQQTDPYSWNLPASGKTVTKTVTVEKKEEKDESISENYEIEEDFEPIEDDDDMLPL